MFPISQSFKIKGTRLRDHRLPLDAQPQDEKSRLSETLGKFIAFNAVPFIYSFLSRQKETLAIEGPIARSEVGFIDLNITEPAVTDICWMDIQIGDSAAQRVEFSLYGEIAPITSKNFKDLCSNKLELGYRGSDIFRIISSFSVQGGNIITKSDIEGSNFDIPQPFIGRYGHSAIGEPFPQENFRILHSFKDAGILSMMKDIKNKNMQDSRFFITTEPSAAWADGTYSAFGRVTKGMSLIKGLSIIPVEPPSNYPKTRVKIIDSGVYNVLN